MGYSKGGLKDCADPGRAAEYAKNSRTAKAGQFDGGAPPSGPKAEPVRLNGVKPPKSTGVK